MATKTTDKTLWTVALIAAFAFAAWKLLPILARKLNGGSSGGGSGVGGGGGVPYFPNDNQQGPGPGGAGQSLGFGSGNGPGNSSNNPYFGGPISAQNALHSFLTGTQQIDQSTTPGGYGFGKGTIADYSTAAESSSSALGNDSIAYQPFTQDTGQLSAFQNWFSTYFLPDQSNNSSVGPTDADAGEYSQIQTVSEDLSDQSISQDQGDLSDYGNTDDYAYNDPGDQGDNGDDGGDDGSPGGNGGEDGGY